MIRRDPSLSEEEDFRRNVEPHIGLGEMAERLYGLEAVDDPYEDLSVLHVGWWIIPRDFYDALDRRAAMERAFSASPEELGEAAVSAAHERSDD